MNMGSLCIFTAFFYNLILRLWDKVAPDISDFWYAIIMVIPFAVFVVVNCVILGMLWYISTGDEKMATYLGGFSGFVVTIVSYLIAGLLISRPKNTKNKPKNNQ